VIKFFPKSPNPKNRIKGYQKRIFGTKKKKRPVKNEFKKGEKKLQIHFSADCSVLSSLLQKLKINFKLKIYIYIYTNSG